MPDFDSAPVPSPLAAVVAECARALQQGDREALGRLFDLTAPRLIRYLRTLTREPADADDALQGALVRVAQRPSQLASAENPWAYLLQMVRNEALKIVQRRRPLQFFAELAHLWKVEDCTTEQDESAACVRSALRRLPPAQAEVIVLKIWEGMTFAEIATVVGDSPNTVASRYRYALGKLSKDLESLAAEVFYE